MNAKDRFSPPAMSSQSPFSRPDLAVRRKAPGMIRPLESADSGSPFSEVEEPLGAADLRAAWDKLYRARSILEREQASLRDDRMAIQAELEALEQREQQLAMREMRVNQIEEWAALEQARAEAGREPGSAFARLTRAPFDIARSVFGSSARK